MIVKNALRLFSQDRTGLADYALESGGQEINSVFVMFYISLLLENLRLELE